MIKDLIEKEQNNSKVEAKTVVVVIKRGKVRVQKTMKSKVIRSRLTNQTIMIVFSK